MNTEPNTREGEAPAVTENAKPGESEIPSKRDVASSNPPQGDIDHGAEAEQAKKIADEGNVARLTSSGAMSGF